jgi:hypothetical protein
MAGSRKGTKTRTNNFNFNMGKFKKPNTFSGVCFCNRNGLCEGLITVIPFVHHYWLLKVKFEKLIENFTSFKRKLCMKQNLCPIKTAKDDDAHPPLVFCFLE